MLFWSVGYVEIGMEWSDYLRGDYLDFGGDVFIIKRKPCTTVTPKVKLSKLYLFIRHLSFKWLRGRGIYSLIIMET